MSKSGTIFISSPQNSQRSFPSSSSFPHFDLADRDQLRSLESYIRSLLRGMVEQIASGDIQPNPYTRGAAHSACTFCPYGSICHETDVPGRRNYERMTAQRFWEEVEREVADHG